MKRTLTALSSAMLWVAGVQLVLLGGLVLAQIVWRLSGSSLPDVDELAGYLMAGSIFLALPYTLLQGDHIQVTLVSARLDAANARRLALLAWSLSLVAAGYLAWHVAVFLFETWRFDERSTGKLSLPMWLPQLPMLLGFIGLFVVTAWRMVLLWRRDESAGAASESV